MELRHLDTLLAIAEEGSFTAAADALSTVQSNVSEQVRQLEAELGAELLVRGRGARRPPSAARSCSTEPAGSGGSSRRCGPTCRCCRASSRARQLRHRRDREPVAGPALVADLRTRRPGVQLRVIEGASERLASEVLAGELAQAVVTEPVTSPRSSSSTSSTRRSSGSRPPAPDLGTRPVPLDAARRAAARPAAVGQPAAPRDRGRPRARAGRHAHGAGRGRGHPAHRRPRRAPAAARRCSRRPRCRPSSRACARCALRDVPPRRLGAHHRARRLLSLADRAVRDGVLPAGRRGTKTEHADARGRAPRRG